MENWQIILSIVAVYCAVVIAVGVFTRSKGQSTLADYFVGNRSLGAFVAFFTYVATFHSSFAFIGAAGIMYAAGIKFFDLITKVDGQSALELGSAAAFDAVRGEEGTDVVLTIFRESTGETMEIRVTRGRITERELQSELLDGNIGYIRISSFSENVNVQFRAAVQELLDQGADSFIFDVRFNPGGRMDVLTDMLDLLLPEVTTAER